MFSSFDRIFISLSSRYRRTETGNACSQGLHHDNRDVAFDIRIFRVGNVVGVNDDFRHFVHVALGIVEIDDIADYAQIPRVFYAMASGQNVPLTNYRTAAEVPAVFHHSDHVP